MRLISGLIGLFFAVACFGQSYPAKPVKIIVGFAPGGGTDLIARIVAQKLTERWGQSVVVENRLGASGNIGADAVAKSTPDGYTLLMAFSSHSSNAALSKLPFDINKDFSSITMVCSAPAVVITSKSLPAKTLPELIAYAKANPGAVKYGSSGIGGTVHLAGELMEQMAGIQMLHVPYKGIALVMTSMLSGDIQVTYATPLSGAAHFKTGRLYPMAIAGKERYPSLPDTPTAAEAGLPGYEVEFWYALLGPAGMPAALVDRIQRDIASLVNAPEMKASLVEQGCIASGSRPEEVTALIRREYATWSKLVRERGIKPE